MIDILLSKLPPRINPIPSLLTWWTARPRGQVILILATAAWLVLGLTILLIILVLNGVHQFWVGAPP